MDLELIQQVQLMRLYMAAWAMKISRHLEIWAHSWSWSFWIQVDLLRRALAAKWPLIFCPSRWETPRGQNQLETPQRVESWSHPCLILCEVWIGSRPFAISAWMVSRIFARLRASLSQGHVNERWELDGKILGGYTTVFFFKFVIWMLSRPGPVLSAMNPWNQLAFSSGQKTCAAKSWYEICCRQRYWDDSDELSLLVVLESQRLECSETASSSNPAPKNLHVLTICGPKQNVAESERYTWQIYTDIRNISLYYQANL